MHRDSQRQVYELLAPKLYHTCKRYLKKEEEIEEALADAFYTILTKLEQLKEFYAFEALTLAPIDTTLVKKELLEQSHIDWLNVYHQNVYAKVSPFLNEEERVFLAKMTSEL